MEEVHLGSIPGNLSCSQLQQILQTLVQVVRVEAYTAGARGSMNCGSAKVVLASKQDAEKLLANPPIIGNRKLKVERFLVGEERKRHKEANDRKRLFLSNLPKRCTDVELHWLFSQFGELDSVYRTRQDSTGIEMNYGYVTYLDEGDAAKVVLMSTINYKGVDIKVDRYQKRAIKTISSTELNGEQPSFGSKEYLDSFLWMQRDGNGDYFPFLAPATRLQIFQKYYNLNQNLTTIFIDPLSTTFGFDQYKMFISNAANYYYYSLLPSIDVNYSTNKSSNNEQQVLTSRTGRRASIQQPDSQSASETAVSKTCREILPRRRPRHLEHLSAIERNHQPANITIRRSYLRAAPSRSQVLSYRKLGEIREHHIII
jgi:RNA recognition motif-containing protein